MTNFYTDKQQIINWLDKYEVKNYTLIPDEIYKYIVDVNNNIDLYGKNLTTIPVKFNEVIGRFYCYYNQLTSLEFSPQIVRGNFVCIGNQLTSLKFCPQKISGDFNCCNNKLTSLEFCPQTVVGGFYCADNPELKEIQEITDFKLILLEHKKALITNFSDKLENELINNISKKTAKIKI